MENIVDYLIVLFFIISFLSSFFKKKKKPASGDAKVKQQQRVEVQRKEIRESQPVENKPRPQKKSSFEEILKAMLEVPEPVTEEVHEEKSEVDAYFEEALKNSEMMEKESPYDETMSFDSTIPANQNVAVKEIEEQNTYLNTILEHHKKHTNQKALEIRRSLLNSKTIKEYIVMNEILGKPLALRE